MEKIRGVYWNHDVWGEMVCIIIEVNNPPTDLTYFNQIQKNFHSREYHVQLEISFDKKDILREFHMVIQDKINRGWSKGWSEPDIIGVEYRHELTDPSKITGHSLLSSDEFERAVDIARQAKKSIEIE